jgi:hypothetical protein
VEEIISDRSSTAGCGWVNADVVQFLVPSKSMRREEKKPTAVNNNEHDKDNRLGNKATIPHHREHRGYGTPQCQAKRHREREFKSSRVQERAKPPLNIEEQNTNTRASTTRAQQMVVG